MFIFFFDSFFSKKRSIRQYDRKIIKHHVSFISVFALEEKSENDEKYISHDSSRNMKKIKQSTNRSSKIVILKKREIRECFKKMKLIFKSKKNSQKTFVVFFVFFFVFQGIVESFFEKKTFDFEKKTTKMTKNFLINEIKIVDNELI